MPRRCSSRMVTMITGISASCGSCRSAAITDQPSRSGIMTSSVIASGLSSRAPDAFKAPGGGFDRKAPVHQLLGDQLARGRVIVDPQDAVGAPDLLGRL